MASLDINMKCQEMRFQNTLEKFHLKNVLCMDAFWYVDVSIKQSLLRSHWMVLTNKPRPEPVHQRETHHSNLVEIW